MDRSLQEGMQTFDRALYTLYKEGRIELEEALAKADSRDGLALKIPPGRRRRRQYRGGTRSVQFVGVLKKSAYEQERRAASCVLYFCGCDRGLCVGLDCAGRAALGLGRAETNPATLDAYQRHQPPSSPQTA